MDLNLRRKCVRILRRACGLETILSHPRILSENIFKEGDVAFTSGDFTDVWKALHDANRVGVEPFHANTVENLSTIKQVRNVMLMGKCVFESRGSDCFEG